MAQRQDPPQTVWMMRRPIIAGNWKMHTTLREAAVLVQSLKATCLPAAPSGSKSSAAQAGLPAAPSGSKSSAAQAGEQDAVDVVVCPPFTALASVGQLLQGSKIQLGAQDVYWEPQGAFTGEVSPLMLADAGCRYVIVGHSERRQQFGETDQTVQRKLRAALQHGLTPIVCVGETLAERDANQTMPVIVRQLEGALGQVSAADCAKLVLAYEPVWAIGTGCHATPAQAQEVHAMIRQWLAKRHGADVAQSLRIQYGGSVTAVNAESLLQQPDVDGALVGGASLKADAFSAIVKAALTTKCSEEVRE